MSLRALPFPDLTVDQMHTPLASDPLPYAAPLFLCKIAAGFPSPATDYIEDGLDLNEYLVQHKAASFMFQVTGQSMSGAGIVDGDKVVVDRSITPKHNHIVIAVVDGDYTIKRLHRARGQVELRAENVAYPPIRFADGQQLDVWGVVVAVVRRYPC
jgi:DNA polymerase V